MLTLSIAKSNKRRKNKKSKSKVGSRANTPHLHPNQISGEELHESQIVLEEYEWEPPVVHLKENDFKSVKIIKNDKGCCCNIF